MGDRQQMLIGAALSALWPQYAQEPARLKRAVARLAALRGVPDWYPRFEPGVVRNGGLRLHVDRIRAQRPTATMVFMPGTNAYTLLYGEYLTALADAGIEVFAFEPRGHGRSDGRRGSYTIAELVDDYRAVLAHVRRTVECPLFAGGSSQGGITALYAGLVDGRLDGLVCHNIADLGDPDSARLTRLGQAGNRLKPAMRLLARISPEFPVPMQAYLDLAREPVRGKRHALQVLYEDPLVPWFVRARTLASLGDTPLPRPLEDFATPVLILQAEHDTIFPRDYIHRLAARIPRATVREFPGTAHYLIVDNTDLVVPAVCEWVSRTGTRSSTR